MHRRLWIRAGALPLAGWFIVGTLVPARSAPETPVLFDLVSAASVHRVGSAGDAGRPRVTPGGGPFEIAPGQPVVAEWTQPRDVQSVALEFEAAAPEAGDFTIEWWRRIWPDNGTGGWMKLDDPFNGQWTKARVLATSPATNRLRFDFAPLETAEAPGIKRTGFIHRHTYKLRLSATKRITVKRFAAFSEAVERPARLRFEWDLNPRVPGNWSPRFEVRNGRLIRVTPSGTNRAIVEVVSADTPNRLSADRGVVTLRSGESRSFSVFVDDVLREGGLFVRDIGVFVSAAAKDWSYQTWPGPKGEVWKEGTVAEQVAKMPEQSFEQVRNAIPAKPPNELLLGAPGLRQEFALGPKGDVILHRDSLRSPGPDAARRPWDWNELTFSIRTDARPDFVARDRREVERSLEDGWLPVVRHRWKQGDVGFKQTCVAAPLLEDLARLRSTNGCEPLVLATRFELTNTAAAPRTAHLWIQVNPPRPWQLETFGLLALDTPSDGTNRAGLTPVRGLFNRRGRGTVTLEPAMDSRTGASCVHYSIELGSNAAHAVEFAVPYLELLDDAELAALRSLDFSATREAVAAFWTARVGQGMTCEVPERFLNDFFKANLWHVLISTDLDPVTGYGEHGAATLRYKNFLNETMMVVRSLEMRGEHTEALRLMQPFLASQGVRPLPGNFKSQDGVFYAAYPSAPDPYTAQGYNLHHGFGLWGLAEHFRWTRDTNWLEGIADQLVKGCDWITRERAATRVTNPDGSRPPEFGLPPAGDLEDVEEYLYWYATAAYFHLGMAEAASALESIGHGSAERLRRDTRQFADEIRASVAESVATTPVVRLRDGAWIPYVPPRVHALTHRSEGWIREALYPALHLWCGGLYPQDHPFVDWMIQEQEDNIYLSKESGYGIEHARTNFFNLGGFTLQPNLVDLPLLYLERDQVPNCLRGFYNTCGASLYPDAVCFAEWVPAFGKGGGPLYKTPDESKFIQWMRALLILERGDRLELGLGVPRAWMTDGKRVKVERGATFFGSVNLSIESRVASGAINATVELQRIFPPRSVALRLRHPDGHPIRRALVNGQEAPVDPARQLIALPVTETQWRVEAHF